MFKSFFNHKYLWRKICGVMILRFVLLRFLVQIISSKFPVSDFLEFSMLDDIYTGKLPLALWGWGNFDGNHYIGIAMRGYFNYEHSFFPLYPLLIKLVSSFKIVPLYAAQGISLTAKLLAMYFMTRLLKLDGKQKLVWLLVAIFLFFPTSFFYSAAYNDSLFLLLATVTIYLARRKKWLTASIIAGVSTLARLNGLVLGIFIVTEYVLESSPLSWNWRVWIKTAKKKLLPTNILKSKIFLVILPLLVFIGYLGFVQLNFGSWTLVFSDMSLWGQDKMIFPLQVFWRYLKILVIYPNFTQVYFTALLEFGFVIGYLFLFVYFFRRIRVSYWVFFVVSILLPSLTGTFQGMPRYGLHLYPLFLMLTIIVDRLNKKVKVAYLFFSGLLLLLLALLFVHGYFIA